MPGLADEAQKRAIAETVAVAAVEEVLYKHPELRHAEIPAPLKWASAVIAGLFTMGLGAMAVWLVTSVSSMQVTLARMDERMANLSSQQGDRFSEIDRRVTRLEAYHSGANK